MYAWADPGDADSMPEHVWGLVAGTMRSCCPGLIPVDAGLGGAARKPPLAEVDEAVATELNVYPRCFCDYILASALAASALSARRLFGMPTAIRTYAFPFSTLTDANPS